MFCFSLIHSLLILLVIQFIPDDTYDYNLTLTLSLQMVHIRSLTYFSIVWLLQIGTPAFKDAMQGVGM